jgi:hypothetical protein
MPSFTGLVFTCLSEDGFLWVNEMEWKPIDSAPFDRDVELAIIDRDGKHALTFPCRRSVGGWVNAMSNKELRSILPTHWRVWIP